MLIKKIRNYGNGLYVLLPRDFLKQLDINKEIIVSLSDNKIIIQKKEEEINDKNK